jgi:hypothetical protein
MRARLLLSFLILTGLLLYSPLSAQEDAPQRLAYQSVRGELRREGVYVVDAPVAPPSGPPAETNLTHSAALDLAMIDFFTWSADGRQAYFTAFTDADRDGSMMGEGDSVLFAADAHGETAPAPVVRASDYPGARMLYAFMSGNGQRLLFYPSPLRPRHWYSYELATGDIVPLLETENAIFDTRAYGPDLSRVVALCPAEIAPGNALCLFEDGEIRLIDQRDDQPLIGRVWWVNPSTITWAYVRMDMSDGAIYTYNVDTGARQGISGIVTQAYAPSRDASRVAFVLDGNLFVQAFGDETRVQLTDYVPDIQRVGRLAWSPDMAWIAFERRSETGSQVWVVPADGSSAPMLASNPDFPATDPVWQPAAG